MKTIERTVDNCIAQVFAKLRVLRCELSYDNRHNSPLARRIGAEEAIGYAKVYKIQNEDTLLLQDYLRTVQLR